MNSGLDQGPELENIRETALRLIQGSAERGKVDFKSQLSPENAKDHVEFCKDLSAIANTDDSRLDGYGFIIYGAAQGELLGKVKAWEPGKKDNFSARLTDIAKKYWPRFPRSSFMRSKILTAVSGGSLSFRRVQRSRTYSSGNCPETLESTNGLFESTTPLKGPAQPTTLGFCSGRPIECSNPWK